MANNINFKKLLQFLLLVTERNKWSLHELQNQLKVSEKELLYILSIISEVYSEQGELLLDYEKNEDNNEVIFHINSELTNLTSINDGELFNIYYLLSTNGSIGNLTSSSKDIENFYNILSQYFKLDGLNDELENNKNDFTFNEINVIQYIKLGDNVAQTYRIKPTSLKSNNDGIVLEGYDVDDKITKSFLMERIIDIVEEDEFEHRTKKIDNKVTLGFEILNKNILKKINSDNAKIAGNKLEYTFFSETYAVNFIIKNFKDIKVIYPNTFVKDFNLRVGNLIKKLET